MIRILTDSACDILPAEAQQLGVTVIPLNVTLEDGTVLRDGIDMTPSEYYTIWQPAASCPPPASPARSSSSGCIWTPLPPETRCWASFCPMRCPAPVSAPDLLPTLQRG